MPIPDLSAEGLLPEGAHTASLEEVREAFVAHARFADTADERAYLFECLCRHRLAVQAVSPIQEEWIGGSLTADVGGGVPSDCDVLYKFDRAEANSLEFGARVILDYLFDLDACQSYFGVHAWLEMLPSTVTSSALIVQDLEVIFSQTKDGRPRGKIVVAQG